MRGKNSVELSVSGLSSGAFAAVQYHVAYSADLMGVGVIAGGPYWCAMGTIGFATTACMTEPELISLNLLWGATTIAANLGKINATSNLANSKVYLYSGTNDTVVNPQVVQKAAEYYGKYINSSNIVTQYKIPSEHGFPTLNYGINCATLGSPFVLNCNFDAAGALLNTIHGKLQAPAKTASGQLVAFNQSPFVSDLSSSGMAPQGYIYYPSACNVSAPTNCTRLHVALHGCEQAYAEVGDAFTAHAGYNYWAESNNIIVLYPQTAPTTMNPDECWDWWGYTNEAYATQSGVQMAAIRGMIRHFIGV